MEQCPARDPNTLDPHGQGPALLTSQARQRLEMGRGAGSFLVSLRHLVQDLGERILLHHIDGAADVDGNDIDLLGPGALEDFELAVHHLGLHVVVLAGANPREQDVLGRVEVDEVQLQVRRVIRRHTDNVAVLALERGAREHHAIMASGQLTKRLLAEIREPVPPVRVCESDAVAHLGNVCWRVELSEGCK